MTAAQARPGQNPGQLPEAPEYKRSSTELFIHRHTLRYRLKQIEELTGLDFKDTEQVFQLFLALVYDYLKSRKLS